MRPLNFLVWYVSYGSNLLTERFLCYIQGGVPPGGRFRQPGCLNQTLPRESRMVSLPGRVSFRGASEGWHGGGVCFLDTLAEGRSIGRMHLISAEQFVHVTEQENGREPGSSALCLNMGELTDKGEHCLSWESMYSRLLWLGEQDGHPMLTFVNAADRVLPEASPSEAYLLTLINGLREMGMADAEIRAYLSPMVDHLGGWISEASHWTEKSLDWDALLAR